MDKVAFAALCLLTFLIPWDNTIALPGLGSLAQLVGIGALGLSVLAVVASGKLRRPHAVHVLAAAFLVWSASTLLWTISLEATLVRTLTYIQVITLMLLIWQQARTEGRQNALFASYVLGAYVPAIDTIRHYVAGQSINPSAIRYSATGFNANEMAIILVLGIPMAWYLALSATRRIYTLAFLCYVPVALVAVLLTASRGAFVALPVALALIPWSFRRLSTRARFAVLAFLIALIGGVGILVPSASWRRLGETRSEISEGDFSERGSIWRGGLQIVLDYPLGGVGAGAFEAATQPLRGRRLPPHQTFLSVLSGQGVIGLGLFLSVFVVAFSYIPKMQNLQRKFWVVLAATFMIGLMPRDWDFRKPTWFLLGVLTAQAALRDATASSSPHRRGGCNLFPTLGSRPRWTACGNGTPDDQHLVALAAHVDRQRFSLPGILPAEAGDRRHAADPRLPGDLPARSQAAGPGHRRDRGRIRIGDCRDGTGTAGFRETIQNCFSGEVRGRIATRLR